MIASRKSPPPVSSVDPLHQAIKDYRRGCAAFEKAPEFLNEAEHERFVAKTYGPPWDTLLSWSIPATTTVGAIEALRLALEEEEDHQTDLLTISMLTAALGFFEQKQRAGESLWSARSNDLRDLVSKAKALMRLSALAAADMPPLGDAEVIWKIDAIHKSVDVCVSLLEQVQDICDGIEFSERAG